MSRPIPPIPPLNWHHSARGAFHDLIAEYGGFTVRIARAGKRWAWSVLAPGELLHESPDGFPIVGALATAKRAAERAVRRRVASRQRRPSGRPRRNAVVAPS